MPTLRNVALTAPYSRAGAYDTLVAVVSHHIDPVASRHSYVPSQLRMPRRADLDPVVLSEKDIARLIDFLHALTDPRMLDLRGDIPASLPSGLPLAE